MEDGIYSLESIDDKFFLKLSGNFISDHNLALAFDEEEIKKNYNLIVDFYQKPNFGSRALSVFLKNKKIYEKNNGRIVFARVDKNNEAVFDLLGFNHFFDFYKSLEEAIYSYKKD